MRGLLAEAARLTDEALAAIEEARQIVAEGGEDEVRELAERYADRPGYAEGWTP